MVESNRLEAIADDNERSLKTLVRAIKLSQRRFSLILAHCNYSSLREQMQQQLHQRSEVEIQELHLEGSSQDLYTTILNYFGEEPINALMVLGLESVEDLDKLLSATNKVRDQFSSFGFPVVLWVTDVILKKLVRIAPDFKNWASPPIQFTLNNEQLDDFLCQKAEQAFAEDPNFTLDSAEIQAAQNDLESRKFELDAKLKASLAFLLGWIDYNNNRIDSALNLYQQSLDFWQQSHDVYRQGVLFLYLGLAHYRRGKENWQESRNSIQQGLDIFEQSQRLDLVAKHIGKLSQILRDLEAWDAVYILAQKALRLHETHGELTQLAHDYGLLAEVALKNCRWDEANQRAQQALKFLDDNPQFSSPNIGLYYWILAQSQQQLGEIQNAISNLEKAKEKTQPQGNPTFYLNILDELRSLYFSQGQYLTAFKLKLEQREIKSKYGLQAFIGAARLQPTFQGSNLSQITAEQQAEIAEMIAKASGRQKDVKELLERIKQPKHKLTVIYGPSGVGKSSLLQAGLVPALQLTSFEGWEYFPVLMQVYTDWMETVSNQLSQALNQPINQLSNIQVLTEQLRSMEKHRMYVVLIFDQFEQFFCDNEQPASRRELYDFLRLCLEGIPYLKVILSLREDYLYHLLHFKRTTTLTKVDINNEDILYYLGNFSEEEAKEVIHSLTERSKFHLEDDLVNAVVQDLGRELGEIRPIELQVVGAQLEAEKITQWAEYDKKGPKEKLVERYLEAVVADCGSEKSENRQIAWKILSLLIDNDQDTRPLRTEKELATLLQLRVEQLKFILDIFAGSGLVFFFKGSLGGHYQLIHDYLVKPIRKKKELDYVNFMTAAEQENIRIKEQQKRSLKRTIIAVIVLILGFGFGMEYRRAELEKCQKNSLIHQPTLKPDSLKR